MSKRNPVTRAIAHMFKKDRWEAFMVFLEHRRVGQKNNADERAPRGVPPGRKSWLFAGSERGGGRAAFMYPLIITASCRVRHNEVFAGRRTIPTGSGHNPPFGRAHGWFAGFSFVSIRHI